ncbi:oxidoreductase [Diplodia corticola]|uniref:Oxidoreductase n=1 Tax=Diplodia corticola TaxID=236234 RepID=A0A1J9R9D2_9PEZI|nr:oxidoreductase [Diplodia corticola]OJD37152.1 oxidoreductase [Diplodia corticola]
MSPIRVGFIGLSATGSWASSAHLPYLKSSSKYRITALLNSSVDSARAAIAAHGLDPSTTKAYGTADDLAAADDVDLVVCSVRVDKHFALLRPLLEREGGASAVKAIYCEWPLGANLAEAEELAELARARGVRTLVGLQGRRAPVGLKVKELVDGGRIGEVLSVHVAGSAWNFGAEDWKEVKYLNEKETGGNMVTIHFSHYFDTVTQAVGQLSSFSSILAIKRPTIHLRDKPLAYKPGPSDPPVEIVETITRETADQVLIQGRLASGALISYHLRGGQEVPGTPGSVWSIYGSTGEIRVTTASGSIHIGGPGQTLQVHDHKTGEVETVSIDVGDGFDQDEYPWPSRNIARLYEAFAEGREHEYADWDEAIVRHRLIDELYWREKKGSGLLPAQYVSDTYGNSLEL